MKTIHQLLSKPFFWVQEMHSLNAGAEAQALSDMFALRTLLSAESASSMYGDPLNHRSTGLPDWNNLAAQSRIPRPQDAAPPVSHDFHCDVSHLLHERLTCSAVRRLA